MGHLFNLEFYWLRFFYYVLKNILFLKEREANEKMRIQLRSLELRVEQNDRELMDARTKLEIEAAKRPSATATADQQGWKSAVMTRTYEEKIRTLESDSDKRVFVE